ncbi:hypothetical protein [Vibrio sp. SCSIO 43136]|uniref:hypothetical protein n=1 Tax=Vibrio sp. SCSIO 43136 TaxID=2819101 RepID=UPI002074C0C0|nr:hypothetical protein [Vibrio sp. SCSIO 43136]USD67276.1 hypothetical protein J4N39_21835 [Vibrio sp. SCSIO 43136]
MTSQLRHFKLRNSQSLALVASLIASTLSGCSTPKEDNLNTISAVTAVPVVSSMATELTLNTPIQTLALTPEKYSIRRIPGWLNRQDAKTLPKADVIIGIASSWPAIDAYPALRANNIAIIPIDVAQAMMLGGESVAVFPSENVSYFWLSPSNALIMIGIMQRDLNQVLETKGIDSNVELRANYASLAESLRKVQLMLDAKIAHSDFMQITIDKPELIDLAAATMLPIVSKFEAEQSGFPTLYLTGRKPNHKSLKELPDHFYVWHIDDFSKLSAESFSTRWQKNIENLPTKRP